MNDSSVRSVEVSIFILGAGRPHEGRGNSVLEMVQDGSRVLDWILHAVHPYAGDIYFACGYQADRVKKLYPSFIYHENDNWESTGSGWSFVNSLPRNSTSCLVTYGDILYRSSIIDKIMAEQSDVVVIIDSHWKQRYAGRTLFDLKRCEKACILDGLVTKLGAQISIDTITSEFIGLVRLSRNACEFLKELIKSVDIDVIKEFALSDIIELLRIRGMEVRSVDVCGDWAELRQEADLARFILGTKAQTLSRLRPMLKKSYIESQVVFRTEEWRINSEGITCKIRKKFGSRKVVVRSSHANEDGFGDSQAGKYTSVLGVVTASFKDLASAIEKVISSYPDDAGGNEVLIQPMIEGVEASGVVLTQTLEYGAPYYIINYTETSSDTDLITSGKSTDHQTLMVSKDLDNASELISTKLKKLIPALKEIETLLHYNALDIEFAIAASEKVYILQVRPITVNHSASDLVDPQKIFEFRDEAKRDFNNLQTRPSKLFGKRTAFGIMPDWNPAEMIGIKPKELAYSLYKYLITDDIWAQQRAEFGYRDVRPCALMLRFAGQPYVDLRASLNSFVPALLSDEITTKIVDSCLDWLQIHPELHDKIEFEVIPTCFTLDFAQWRQHFTEKWNFTNDEMTEWESQLKVITKKSIDRVQDDLESISHLEKRYQRIVESDLSSLEKAVELISDARRYGTLPFAHLARSAFVAIAILRSAVNTNNLDSNSAAEFMESIHTVAHDMHRDAYNCRAGKITWEEFVRRYGHLRPGTYDITSPSYKNDLERFLRPLVLQSEFKSERDDKFTRADTFRKVVEKLNSNGLSCSEDNFEKFVRTAVVGREFAKFMFTRNVSTALDELIRWGNRMGLDVDVLSEVGIDDFWSIHSESISIKADSWLKQRCDEVREYRGILNALELPPLIFKQEDFEIFEYPSTQPNYIGRQISVGKSLELKSIVENQDFSNKIVLIPQADPGYDWLFGGDIRGLITMYGGANSHMAIRASEFGVTAAIGVGESRYKALAQATEIEINPIEKLLRILN